MTRSPPYAHGPHSPITEPPAESDDMPAPLLALLTGGIL